MLMRRGLRGGCTSTCTHLYMKIQDLMVDSPFKVPREFDFRSGKQPLPYKFGYSHYLDNEWILLGGVTG